MIQDTLVRLKANFGKFPGNSYVDLVRWSRTVLFRRRLEWVRNATRRSDDQHFREILRLLRERTDGDTEFIELQEDVNRIRTVLAELKQHEQQVVKLRIFEQLTFPQIGELTHQQSDTVRRTFDRAIDKLRRKFLGRG